MTHESLSGLTFQLGSARYVVARTQPYRHEVRCYRTQDDAVSVVRLPLVFVLEQLAVEVALVAPA